MASILVIDDSLFIRKSICAVVKALGHETKEAADGQAGLDLAATHTFDCIITDLLMPKLDGFDVLEGLQSHGSTVPVIVVSADIQDSTRDRCLSLGAKLIVNKPPKEDRVKKALMQVLPA
jgi:CheY-like chemotaxis protein